MPIKCQIHVTEVSENLIHFCLPRDEHLVIFIFKLGVSRLRKFKPVQIPLAIVISVHKIKVYYIRCAQYQPLPPPLGGREGRRVNFQFQVLKRGNQKENESLEGGVGLKEFLPQIFAWRVYYVPCEKRLRKIKYAFEGWFG